VRCVRCARDAAAAAAAGGGGGTVRQVQRASRPTVSATIQCVYVYNFCGPRYLDSNANLLPLTRHVIDYLRSSFSA